MCEGGVVTRPALTLLSPLHQSAASVPIKFSPDDGDCDLSDSLVDISITWAEYTVWEGRSKPVAVVHHGRSWRAHDKVRPRPTIPCRCQTTLSRCSLLAGRPNHTSHSRTPYQSLSALTPYPLDSRTL